MTLSRRHFIAGTASVAALGAASPAFAQQWYAGSAIDSGVNFRTTNFSIVDPKWRRQMVIYNSQEKPGTVVIDTRDHYLYWIWENNTALRYGVGVGKEGFKWYGRARIDRKVLWPRWVPPAEMRKRSPNLPKMVEGGSPKNPLGPRGLYLHANGGDTGYRIHGNTAPWSIGKDASSGCIRMFNEDVIDLYQRCPIGTEVLVLEHLGGQEREGVRMDNEQG
ncbi:MAG: L,D-transpeptidase [Pseudomonadota bacterium]